MKPKRMAFVLIVVALVMLTSCAAKTASDSAVKSEMARDQAAAPEAPRVDYVVESESVDYGGGAGAAESLQQMIIRTASITVVVEDSDVALDSIRNMVDRYEGYVASSNRWLSNDQAYARATLRVPADMLDQAMAEIAGMAIRVEDESTHGEDVTEEYVDLQARLRNLEATEEELLMLLTEVRENRGKAEDILAIHREITSIRSDIESLKGRSQYLERMTAMATISVEIRPKEAPRPVVDRASWNPLVTANNALRGFVTVFQGLLDILIYVLIFSPFILVPILVIWLLARWIRRRRKQRDDVA